MPLTKLSIAPGVQADLTSYAAERSWRLSDKIRFRDGRAEPIGGYLTLDAGVGVIGTGRAGHIWAENNTDKGTTFIFEIPLSEYSNLPQRQLVGVRESSQ